MQDTELKIGNIVFLKSRNKIYTIQSGYDIDTGCDSDDFEPIPLTEEWLLKFGFEEVYRSKYRVKYDLTNNPKIGYDIAFKGDFINGFRYVGEYLKIEYVHQLQNLYQSLTLQELTIKQQ
jgi:hypothetical protein